MSRKPDNHFAKRLSRWLVPAAAMLCLGGCSHAEVGRVAGKVTLAGKSLAEGAVVFNNAENGVTVAAPLGGDGTYVVKTYNRDGLPPGRYTVAVMPGDFNSNAAPPRLVEPSREAPGPRSKIPARYWSAATSGLAITVKAGSNPSADFNLVP